MKKKILGIFVCMLLIACGFSSLCIAKSEYISPEKTTTGPFATIELVPSADSYIFEFSPNENFGTQGSLNVLSREGIQMISYVFFDIVGIPSGSTIQHADFHLWYKGQHHTPAGRSVYIKRVTEQWYEDTITWANPPGAVGLITEFTVPPYKDVWIQIDMTDEVYRIFNGGFNYGWVLYDPDSQTSTGYGTIYASREVTDKSPKLIIQYNSPPNKPTISGPSEGKTGTSYDYTFTSTDPEGDDVSYNILWGDGGTTTWTSYQASGTSYTGSHTWASQGTYTIEAQTKDTEGGKSGWASKPVTMPRNKAFIFNFPLLSWLFERFPNVFPILRQLLEL